MLDLNRSTITFLIVVIGGLFAALTYVRESIALGVIGIGAMLLLGWISKEYTNV